MGRPTGGSDPGGSDPGGSAGWAQVPGVVRLPGGSHVRGRRVRDVPAIPADFSLLLAEPPPTARPVGASRRVRWPDFWVPLDRTDALDALHETLRRARAGERVEVACHGGRGRTGTALAALAMLDGGLSTPDAVRWVRRVYHPGAVETPWQRWWLRGVH